MNGGNWPMETERVHLAYLKKVTDGIATLIKKDNKNFRFMICKTKERAGKSYV